MARIYAEAAERKGHKVEVAFEKEAAKTEDVNAVKQSEETSETEGKSEKPEQEIIVLRGGFTRW